MQSTAQKKSSTGRKVVIYFFLFLLIVVLIGGTLGLDTFKKIMIKKIFSKPMIPVVTISTTKASSQNWTHSLPAVGTVAASEGVSVTPRVSGIVTSVFFHSGDQVKAGQILVQLDDSLDKRVLASDLVQLNLDKLSFQRNLKVAQRTGSVSKKDLDIAKGTLEQQRNKVAQDQLNIEFKKIRAPFAGKLGIRQVNKGQFLQAGSEVATLQNLDKVNVDFNLAQDTLSKVFKGQEVILTTSSYPGQSFTGKVTAVSPKLEQETRTLKVRATFNNEKHRLLPGQFVNLALQLPVKRNVITVPLTAIAFTLYGDTVYVVESSNNADKKGNSKKVLIAVSKQVVVGARKGNLAVIKSGINAGDEVVISGQLKLHNGSHVKINNL